MSKSIDFSRFIFDFTFVDTFSLRLLRFLPVSPPPRAFAFRSIFRPPPPPPPARSPGFRPAPLPSPSPLSTPTPLNVNPYPDFQQQHHHHLCTHIYDTPYAIAMLHRVKRVIDSRKHLSVTDELVHLQLSGQVIVNQIGKLRATLDATEGATFPYSARHELEGCQ